MGIVSSRCLCKDEDPDVATLRIENVDQIPSSAEEAATTWGRSGWTSTNSSGWNSTLRIYNVVIENEHLSRISADHIPHSKCSATCMKDHCRMTHFVCGTPLTIHRDPLQDGSIQTGVLDVDGSGKVNCKDCHDACFLAYPVEHPPPPKANDFMEMQERHRGIMALEDLPTEVTRKIPLPVGSTFGSSNAMYSNSEELENSIRKLASESGESPDKLRRAACELHYRMAKKRLQVRAPFLPDDTDHATKLTKAAEDAWKAAEDAKLLAIRAAADATKAAEGARKATQELENSIQFLARKYGISPEDLRGEANHEQERSISNMRRLPFATSRNGEVYLVSIM